MPTLVNIAGTSPVDDPSYRYKMPLVYGKVEGKGNGIKTVIPNISDLSLSLHRDAGEVNKFFGCELGAQTTYSEATDRAVVNGSHADAALQGMVHKYIEGFVLCPECGLPETHYKFKDGCIFHKCAACGAKEMVDMEHKLCTYILAQHKKQRKQDKKDKKDKKEAPGGEKKKKVKKEDKADKDSGDDAKAKKKKKKSKKKDKKAKKEDKTDDADKLASDVDELSISSDTGVVDDSAALELAVQGVKTYLLSNPTATPSALSETVVNQQMASAPSSPRPSTATPRSKNTPRTSPRSPSAVPSWSGTSLAPRSTGAWTGPRISRWCSSSCTTRGVWRRRLFWSGRLMGGVGIRVTVWGRM